MASISDKDPKVDRWINKFVVKTLSGCPASEACREGSRNTATEGQKSLRTSNGK